MRELTRSQARSQLVASRTALSLKRLGDERWNLRARDSPKARLGLVLAPPALDHVGRNRLWREGSWPQLP